MSRSVLLTVPTLQLRWKLLVDGLHSYDSCLIKGRGSGAIHLKFLIVPPSGIPW
jgi:hypothetical protein